MTTPLPEIDLDYEAASHALDEIVNQLESGQLSLDESVTLYERGRLLAAHCEKLLDAAELRIQRVSGDAEQGITVTPESPF